VTAGPPRHAARVVESIALSAGRPFGPLGQCHFPAEGAPKWQA
jgi:hypothetical protein